MSLSFFVTIIRVIICCLLIPIRDLSLCFCANLVDRLLCVVRVCLPCTLRLFGCFVVRSCCVVFVQRCDLCSQPVLTRQFYLFPCLHVFHLDCITSEVKQYLDKNPRVCACLFCSLFVLVRLLLIVSFVFFFL